MFIGGWKISKHYRNKYSPPSRTRAGDSVAIIWTAARDDIQWSAAFNLLPDTDEKFPPDDFIDNVEKAKADHVGALRGYGMEKRT